MARKNEKVKKIDQKSQVTGMPQPIMQDIGTAPSAMRDIPAPDNLQVTSQYIQLSAQAPQVVVNLSWDAPSVPPSEYRVQYSEFSDFTDPQYVRTYVDNAAIEHLKTNTTYYFRVQGVIGTLLGQFSDSISALTMSDSTPAPDVSNLTLVFSYGNLVMDWDIPSSALNYKDTEITVYNSAGTVLYGTYYSRNGHFVWSADENKRVTSGSPLTSVLVKIRSRSFGNAFGSYVSNTATAPIPATPAGFNSNWSSDDGTASADLLMAWSAVDNASFYDLTIDGKAYTISNLQYLYRYETNVSDHKPALASGDPNVLIALKARDNLGQVSTAYSTTVVNLAPTVSMLSLNVNSGFSQIAASVKLVNNTIIQDFDHFEWTLTPSSGTPQVINSADNNVIFQVNQSDTYNVSVLAVDKFNQKSVATTVSGVVIDTLTIAQLRAETQYTDSLNTSASVLNRLKDGILYDGSGTYVFYGANSSWQ